MEIRISNYLKLTNIPQQLKEVLINNLKTINPQFSEAERQGYNTYGIDQYIFNYILNIDGSMYIPRGYRLNLYTIMNEMGLTANIIDNRTKFEQNFDIDSRKFVFRPYQNKAISELVHYDEGMLVAPAGSGKTVMGLSLIPIFGQPTLWLTHTKPLATQALNRISSFLPSLTEDDIGFIGSGKWDVGKTVTVAIIQTLIRNLDKLRQLKDSFGLVLLDEAHHCPAKTFRNVITQLNPYYLVGLTATDYRRDKLEKVMFQVIGDCRSRILVEEVKKDGGIMVPKVLYRSIESGPVRVQGENILIGNKIQSIIKNYIIGNKKRNQIIVSDVVREAVKGNFCIVMSDRKEHCEELHELISAIWEKSGIATGSYSKKQIDEQIKKFENNEITVLTCTSALLGEGFDVNFLNRAFVAMPFRAENKAEQILGRVQRTAKGKKDAILYDYVDVDCSLLVSQFHRKFGACRYNAYNRVGAIIEPY
jgi:superfamily II DNA or RNA helicase